MRRERDRTRRAVRSKEEREAALLRMRAYGRSRVANETADERQAADPLAAIMYVCKQLERLAAEPTDDRQAVLQRLRTCVRRLKRMALPRAIDTRSMLGLAPQMLCIH